MVVHPPKYGTKILPMRICAMVSRYNMIYIHTVHTVNTGTYGTYRTYSIILGQTSLYYAIHTLHLHLLSFSHYINITFTFTLHLHVNILFTGHLHLQYIDNTFAFTRYIHMSLYNTTCPGIGEFLAACSLGALNSNLCDRRDHLTLPQCPRATHPSIQLGYHEPAISHHFLLLTCLMVRADLAPLFYKAYQTLRTCPRGRGTAASRQLDCHWIHYVHVCMTCLYDCRSKGPCPLQRPPGFQQETLRKFSTEFAKVFFAKY